MVHTEYVPRHTHTLSLTRPIQQPAAPPLGSFIPIDPIPQDLVTFICTLLPLTLYSLYPNFTRLCLDFPSMSTSCRLAGHLHYSNHFARDHGPLPQTQTQALKGR